MSGDGGEYEGSGNGTEELLIAPPWLRGLHATAAMALMLTSLVGNALVAVLVVRYKELHYRSIFASMGAVVVNISYSLFTNPQVLAGSVTGQWPFGETACSVLGFASVSLFYVRWLNTCLIALDRFLNVVAPFFYERHSKAFLIVLTAVVWTLPFISVIPTFWFGGGFAYRPTLMFCAQTCPDDDLTCVHIFVAMFGAYLVVGVLVPTFLYLYLYCLGLKKRWSMKRSQRLGTHLQQSGPAGNGHLGPCSAHPGEGEEGRGGEGEGEGEKAAEKGSGLTGDVLKSVNHLAVLEEGRRLNGVRELNGVEETLNLTDLKFRADMFTPRDSPLLLPCNGSISSHDVASGETSANGNHHMIQDNHHVTRDASRNGGLPSKEEAPEKNQRTSNSSRRNLRSLSPPQSPSSRRGSTFAIFALLKPGKPQWTHEKQAMTTFIIIFISLVVTQFPLYFVVTHRRSDWYDMIPLWFHFLCVNLYFLAPALEPIIIMRSTDFKTALYKMFVRRGSFSVPSS